MAEVIRSTGRQALPSTSKVELRFVLCGGGRVSIQELGPGRWLVTNCGEGGTIRDAREAGTDSPDCRAATRVVAKSVPVKDGTDRISPRCPVGGGRVTRSAAQSKPAMPQR